MPQKQPIYLDKIEKNNENTSLRLEAYARFFEIISEKGITPYSISKNVGIATSTLSDWKNGKSMPKSDKMKKIADYIGADVDYIITGERKTNFETLGKEHAELLKMYEMLNSEEKEQIINMMKLLIKNK